MPVRLEKQGGAGIIVLDQPPANSYDYTFLRSFPSAVDDIRTDDEIGAGGTQRWPRLVGLWKGIDLIANATTMNPAQAKELGLVDRLFPDAAACRAGAIEYAAKLAAGPRVAIGHAKVAITQGYGAPLDLGLAIEREAISRVFVSKDADEGIKAFGEKRKADFKGL